MVSKAILVSLLQIRTLSYANTWIGALWDFVQRPRIHGRRTIHWISPGKRCLCLTTEKKLESDCKRADFETIQGNPSFVTSQHIAYRSYPCRDKHSSLDITKKICHSSYEMGQSCDRWMWHEETVTPKELEPPEYRCPQAAIRAFRWSAGKQGRDYTFRRMGVHRLATSTLGTLRPCRRK